MGGVLLVGSRYACQNTGDPSSQKILCKIDSGIIKKKWLLPLASALTVLWSSKQFSKMITLFVYVTSTHLSMVYYLFQIAAQTCNFPPKVLEVDETTSPKASDFYTILQA